MTELQRSPKQTLGSSFVPAQWELGHPAQIFLGGKNLPSNLRINIELYRWILLFLSMLGKKGNIELCAKTRQTLKVQMQSLGQLDKIS